MATASSKRTARSEDQGTDKWSQVLDSLKTGGPFVFPKEGKTRIRLVLPKDEDELSFYREVVNSYGRSRYLVLAIVPDSPDPDVIKPVVLPKTVLTGIISALSEGYDLLGEEAHGLTINRSGSGFNSEYSVLPSNKAHILSDDVKWPDQDLDELAEEFTKSAAKRKTRQSSSEDDNTEDDYEDPQPRKKSAKGRTSW